MISLDEIVKHLINRASSCSNVKDLVAENDVIDTIQHLITPWVSEGRQKGVQLQTYLSYINVASLYFLNCNNLVSSLKQCEEFARLYRKFSPIIKKEEYYEHVNTWSEALFRRGNHLGCQSLIRQSLPAIGDKYLKCSMLIRLGVAEAQSIYPNLHINSLCEALGCAEELNDAELIAQCYVEIAKLMCVKYNWLAISLLCDAEVRNERVRDSKMYSEIMMHKAISFYCIYLKSEYNKDCEVYLEKAKDVLALVRQDDITQDSAKALYDMYYGQIYADIGKLKDSLLFYERVGSIDNIICVCDHILVAAYRNKNYKEGLEIIPKYIRYESMLDDSAQKNDSIKKILEIEKELKCLIPSSQT
jgi:hypothetical protein